jgi:hypothetical protein
MRGGYCVRHAIVATAVGLACNLSASLEALDYHKFHNHGPVTVTAR